MTTKFRPRILLTGDVAGSLDHIDGAILSAGDVCSVVNSTGSYDYVNIQDSAVLNSPYTIPPVNNPGNNSWHLVIPQGSTSHVIANTSAGQSIPDSTSTTVIFGTEEKDSLGEYDHTTGIFTALNEGYYNISAVITYNDTAWTIGDRFFVTLKKSGSNEATAYDEAYLTATFREQPPPISKTVYLTVGQTLLIEVYQDSGGAETLLNVSEDNYFTIDRLI